MEDIYYTFDEANEICDCPSLDDVRKLVAETTYEWDYNTNEGVFTWADGAELRLPATGVRGPNGVHSVGSFGSFWLKDRFPLEKYGYYFYVGAYEPYWYQLNKNIGCCLLTAVNIKR